MTDLNISEKVTEALNNVIKKTKLFEKLDTIQFHVSYFVIFSTIIGATSLSIQYFNTNKINKHNKELSEKYDLIINKLENNNNYIKDVELKINDIKLLLEEQQKILINIYNLPLLSINNLKTISSTSSIFSLESHVSSTKNESQYFNNEETNDQKANNKETDYNIIDNNNNNDDELLNDCYDNLPLNNIKKTTGLKGWLF